MKLSQPRTHLELRVGESAVVSVVLLVKQKDLDWFNSNDKDHCQELYQILQEQVLPRILFDSVEEAHYQNNPNLKRPPATLIQGGIALATEQPKQKPSSRKQRGPRKMTKKQLKQLAQQEKQAQADSKSATRASQRPYLWAFGPHMQLCYRSERCTETTATLVFAASTTDDSKKRNTRLSALEPLPHKLLVACGPVRNRNERDENGLLLLQPEQIPIAQLFRQRPDDAEEEEETETRATKRPRPQHVIELD